MNPQSRISQASIHGLPTRVLVRVPGSTSNLGSGFDTLGIALSIYNTIDVARAPETHPTRNVRILSPIQESVRSGAESMIQDVADFFQAKLQVTPPALEIRITGDVPVARGLGSSVTLRLGILAALARLTGVEVTNYQLGEWVSEIEGHPDNAMASALGGFCAAGWGDQASRISCHQILLPDDYCFVTLVPDFEVKTDEARKALPSSYSKADVVRAINRAAMVTGLISANRIEDLAGFFDDPVHQPYRAQLIPGFEACMQAGREAGAFGGWISGSGSTLMWITRGNGLHIGVAVQSKMPGASLYFLRPDNIGITFLEHLAD
jgi:homoserine kinase